MNKRSSLESEDDACVGVDAPSDAKSVRSLDNDDDCLEDPV